MNFLMEHVVTTEKRSKMNKKTVLTMLAAFSILPLMADVPDVRTAISNFCVTATARSCPADYVSEWGYSPRLYGEDFFKAAVATVSNDWQTIASDWPYYTIRTEERTAIGELIGFAGTNAFFGIINAMITDAQTNAVTKKVLPNCVFSTSTPMRTYVVYHYSTPSVSNILIRMLSIYDDTPSQKTAIQWCLSGKMMRRYEDRRMVEEAEH